MIGLALAALPLFASCGLSENDNSPMAFARPREVESVPVKSSHLQSVGYVESSRILTIEFRDSVIYEYENVTPEIHSELMTAESYGKYFHQHLRSAGLSVHRIH